METIRVTVATLEQINEALETARHRLELEDVVDAARALESEVPWSPLTAVVANAHDLTERVLKDHYFEKAQQKRLDDLLAEVDEEDDTEANVILP
jgi:hypothetical protein